MGSFDIFNSDKREEENVGDCSEVHVSCLVHSYHEHTLTSNGLIFILSCTCDI